MIIDILSDLHLDYYFPPDRPAEIDAIKSIFDPIFFDNQKRKTGDVLIIAGDIGHYNHQNLQVLKIFQGEYYKNIICVLGNHDYYLINNDEEVKYSQNSFNRVAEMREMINAEKDMYCLDGNVIEIDGIKFGGCDSSYSDAYLNKYFNGSPFMDRDVKWRACLYDYKGMNNVNYYDTIYKLELPKIKAVYKECDVMITHVNPSYLHEHMAPSYQDNEYNMFFTFDGHMFMKNGSIKYWVFGHTHDTLEYEYNGVKCICNPLGYPTESYYGDDTWIKSIELG